MVNAQAGVQVDRSALVSCAARTTFECIYHKPYTYKFIYMHKLISNGVLDSELSSLQLAL